MIQQGIVKDYEIGPNADGEENVVKLTCQITSEDDVQTVEYITGSQTDAIPEIGSAVYLFDVNGNPANKVAIAIDNNIESDVENGEKKIYSQENQVIKSFIYLKKDGTIDINGSADFAVRYNALNTVLQQLVTDINAALATKQDASGTAGTLTLDLTSSRVDEVKLP